MANGGGRHVVAEIKNPDGSTTYEYRNGDKRTVGAGDVPPKPDGNWTPDTGNADGGNPWNIYKGSQPPFPPPPKVPGGVNSPGKDVHVISVKAILTYADNIEALLPVIRATIKDLDDLAAKGFGPGNFGAANLFKARVFGAAGGQSGATLLASTRAVFVQAETIIKEVATRCREIAQKYKTVNELSELDAKEFSLLVSGVKAKVDNLSLGAAVS